MGKTKSVKKSRKTKKEFELWANKKLKEIQGVLLMNHFKLEPIKESSEHDTSYSITRYPYKESVFQYGKNVYDSWARGDKEEALSILIHESFHPLTDPLYCKAVSRYTSRDELEHEREGLTDHLTNIILKAKLIKP